MIAEKPFFFKFIRLFFLIIIIVLLAFAEILAFNNRNLTDKIYPNVSVNNVNFGQKNKEEVAVYLNKKNQKLENVRISIIYKNQGIATLSGQLLNLGYDATRAADLAFKMGRSKNFLQRAYEQLLIFSSLRMINITIPISYDRSYLSDYITTIEEQYGYPAKNALFKFEAGRVVSFRQEELGKKIKGEEFINEITQIISSFENEVSDKKIVLKDEVIKPELTLAEANQFGIEELIGEGVSNYSHSIPERIHNVILGASKFNGIFIPKNKVFSFNEALGDVSSLTGYKQAYIIKDGKTVLGDGGGICQVSTTFFRAALNTGLPFVERHAHAYRVGYYETDSKPGLDATVFGPTVDLRVKNDTPTDILIETEVDQNNSLLYFRFYGKKDGRKAEISTPVLYDVQPPPPDVYQDDPTLKKGVVRQIDFAAWGGKASFNYKVTRGTQTLIDGNFLSVYRPWQAVYLRGTAD